MRKISLIHLSKTILNVGVKNYRPQILKFRSIVTFPKFHYLRYNRRFLSKNYHQKALRKMKKSKIILPKQKILTTMLLLKSQSNLSNDPAAQYLSASILMLYIMLKVSVGIAIIARAVISWQQTVNI